jgi:dihydrofolate synthase/folylpolyglutamate synthase
MQSSQTNLEQTARQSALDWLMARINYERTPLPPYQDRQLKLDRMRQLLTRLGQPDVGMKIIHVAGTKGKGSTCAMLSSILTAAGYRTGLFSSPHLERIEERFAIDGTSCTSEELVTLVNRVRAEVHAMDEEATANSDPAAGPTYFEITTAMALLHFVERGADAVILEVGLGGRLDSTNVCLPAVSVITSISFDHMRQLGNTLAAIAREKAGIIKPGVPVVSGVLDPEPQQVIAEIALNHGCRLIQLERDFTVRYERAGASPPPSSRPAPHSTIDFRYSIPGQESTLPNVDIRMPGLHQAQNAAVALATIAELRHQGWCISNEAIRQGLSQAMLPGRVEILPGNPTVVLDTAHNPASARALVQTLAELPPVDRRTLILSISSDKDVPAIAREMIGHFDRIIVTQYQENPRAVPADALLEIVRNESCDSEGELIVCKTPREAWLEATKTTRPREQICITGSFYLAAEMRPLILAAQAAETFTPVSR